MGKAGIDLEYAARSIFRRCVQCPNVPPACPSCPSGQTCELFSGDGCSYCSYTKCVATGSNSGTASSSSGAPIGPIVGGVVGGVVFIVAVVSLLYWFWIRPRRQRAQEEEWQDEQEGIEKDGMNQFSVGDPRRASTHTVGSVASTVLTRASNIIQIAYIPGVTNRSMHSSPDLVPPVPPIPAASAGTSAVNSPRADEHFFRPEDLRQSSYSNLSAATSMTRGSIASTTYRNDAIVNPMPAQAVTRMKPNAVSVKSSAKNTPNMSRSASPPLPTSSYAASASSLSQPTRQPTLNTKSSIVGKVGQPKAITVTRKGSNSLRPHKQGIYELDGGSNSSRSISPLSAQRPFARPPQSPQYSHHSSTFRDGNSSDEEEDEVHELAGQSLMPTQDKRRSHKNVHETPTSPLNVPSYQRSPELGGPSGSVHKRNSSLGSAIKEATKLAAQTQISGYHPQPETSPFSDANAATTP